MTTAAIPYDYIGFQPIINSSASIEVAANATLYTPLQLAGSIVPFFDPYYGGGMAIRLVIPANTTAIKVGTLATWGAATNAGVLSNFSYVIAPSTANLNKPFAVALTNVPLNATFPQYAWFAIQGTVPVLSTVATAINTPLYISATAGAAFVTLTAGKQLVGVNPVVAATGTVTKSTATVSGSANVRVSTTDGLFVGQALTGTGIPASTAIGALSQDGTIVSMVQTGTTTAQLATATGNITMTATNNDGTNFWPICQMNNPFFQGNVT